MELVPMQTPNHEICCTIGIRGLSDNLAIQLNLLDEDDVAYTAHVSLGTWKTVFCCSIVSAILTSCALPIEVLHLAYYSQHFLDVGW